MTDFKDRYGPIALVTGASSGIGLAFAEELAERGFDLVLAARRTDRMEALAAELKDRHGTTTTVLASDLSDPAAPAALLEATAGMDVGLLVSNAGFNLKGAYEAKDAGRMAKMLTVNCHAPMQLAHGFIPRLKARGRGGLLFTSSVEGLIGCPYSTAYAATKALVVSLGEGLWGELQGTGVDVLTMCPGATESEATLAIGMKPEDLQPAREAVRLTLGQLGRVPTYVPSDKYRGMFEHLRAQPRPETLASMSEGMKQFAT